jgi:hypothetical protein
MVKKLSRSEQRNRLKREAKRQGVSYDSLGKKKSNTSHTSDPVEDGGDGTLAGVGGSQGGDVFCEGAAGTAAASPLLSLPLCQDTREKEGIAAPCCSLSHEREHHCDAGNAASGDRGGAASCMGAAGIAAVSPLFSIPVCEDGREKRVHDACSLLHESERDCDAGYAASGGRQQAAVSCLGAGGAGAAIHLSLPHRSTP